MDVDFRRPRFFAFLMMTRLVLALLLLLTAAAPGLGARRTRQGAGRRAARFRRRSRGEGYRLVKNWDFGITVKTVADLRREFYTRFVYNGGRLDHLKGEWQRYGEDDNHRIEGNTLELVARLAAGSGRRHRERHAALEMDRRIRLLRDAA